MENNIIECIGEPRPLFRNAESAKATIANNPLINISDTDRYKNPKSDKLAGLEAPLSFTCGVNGELSVVGWETNMTRGEK